MQSNDEDSSSANAQWTVPQNRVRHDDNTDARGSGQEALQSVVQNSTEDSESNTTQTMGNSDSPDLIDTFSRLQQIHSALSYLEESLVRADSTEPQDTSEGSRDSTSTTDAGIGPSHSAIVLSEEENSPPQFEGLRERFGRIERNFPQYMLATTELVRRRQQNQQGPSQPQDRRTSSISSGSLTNAPRRSDNTAAEPPRNRTPDATQGRTPPVRPARDMNRSTERNVGLLRPESRPIPEPRHTHTLPAWRTAYRDDDSPSTLLGRRVASRAAARTAAIPTPEPRGPRQQASSALFWQGQVGTPSVVLPRPGRAGASRVVVPPRVPDRVSRRIAQFESAASERQPPEDSDGSETEVYPSHYTYRRPVVRRHLVDRSTITERLQRAVEHVQPASPPQLTAISPSSSLGSTSSISQSSSDPSSQQAEGERPAVVSDRMQNVYGHLQRLSSALIEATSGRSPSSSSTDGGDLDGALFSRTATRRQAGGEELYHEVVDEEEGRSYRILRRLNADGDEQVHQLNSDPWADSTSMADVIAALRGSVAGGETERRVLSAAQAGATNSSNDTSAVGNNANAMSPAVERLRRIFQSARQNQQSETDLPPLITDLPSTNTNMATRRRRGWARLDANGDEIPTDEEEEIDRILTARRIRSSQGAAWRASTNASSSSSSTVRTRLEYLAPTTRSVFSHGTDEEEDEEHTTNDIRVRLNLSSALAPRRFTGPTPRFNVFSDAWKEKEKEREQEQEFFGTSEPYFVSPVPMPFEELVSPGPSRSDSRDSRNGSGELREREVAGL